MARKEDFDPIEIDERHLDREWQAQPRLMYRALRNLAQARMEERAAKAKLELIEAELALAVRRTPERYGLGAGRGPSNDVVAATVVVQQEYRIALQELSEAKYHGDVIDAEVTALSHKKAGIENMVILYCRQYGAECRLPAEHAQAAKEKFTERSPFKDVTRPIDE